MIAMGVFCAWTTQIPMSPQREEALRSMYLNIEAPVIFLRSADIAQISGQRGGFHQAFQYLSATHRADYLRVYLMHHYGGGYSDIKLTDKSWSECFIKLSSSPDLLCVGYTEVGPSGVAKVACKETYQVLTDNWRVLIGVCAFIFKPKTELTSKWLKLTHLLLDEKFEQLRTNPARHPQDVFGRKLAEGQVSSYPLGWTELLGNIFHPLIFEYREAVLHADIAPSFKNYR